MHKQEIVNKLVEKPSYFKKGSEYLATYFGTNTDTIVKAKKEARAQLSTGSGELSDVKSDGRSEWFNFDDINKCVKFIENQNL